MKSSTKDRTNVVNCGSRFTALLRLRQPNASYELDLRSWENREWAKVRRRVIARIGEAMHMRGILRIPASAPSNTDA